MNRDIKSEIVSHLMILECQNRVVTCVLPNPLWIIKWCGTYGMDSLKVTLTFQFGEKLIFGEHNAIYEKLKKNIFPYSKIVAKFLYFSYFL